MMTGTLAPLHAFLDLPQVPVAHAQSGPLVGLGLAVKDVFDVKGYATGCGNLRKAETATAAPRTAPAVQMILDAGARFAGKTQTDELAFSLMGQNAHFPHPVNPAAPDRVTGGSSSGSASAVAGGLADIATGSDTGGSIRAPASFCGLIGLRTSHGLISLEGAMPLAVSFDTFGWFAKDMGTYRKVAEVLLGGPSSEAIRPRLLAIEAVDGLVLGAVEADEYRRMAAMVAARLGQPKASAAFSMPIDELYWAFRRLQAFEAWANHGPWISQGERGLGPGVKERFAFGWTIDRAIVDTETVRRDAFRAELADRLGSDGFLVMPTVPGAAPLAASTFNETQAYREQALRFLCLSGLSGFPQLTLPLGTVGGAPFGLSLLGPKGSDMTLLALGSQILEAA